MGNILVIDDEESLRHTLGRVLRQAGYEVTTAGEGNEALRLVNSGYENTSPYDVVYLDIRLPGMDGLQVLKEIRQRDAHLPVILLTAYGSLKTALEALRLGATDYLIKPLDPEVLVARTASCWKSRRWNGAGARCASRSARCRKSCASWM